MAWCSEHDCPPSLCEEFRHGPAPAPVPVIVVATIGREVIETVAEQLAERIEDALAGNAPADALAILAELKTRIANMETDHRFALQRGRR